LRAFIALEISDAAVVDALAAFQGRLPEAGADLKLVERENLHFTVKFLGEVSDSQAEEADSRLRGLGLAGGQVEVRGVGAFPDANRPRVVWAGVSPADEGRVETIARAVIGALEGIGEEDRRAFSPHVTLARVRSSRNLPALAAFLDRHSDLSFGITGLAELKLKSSTLTPGGPVYNDVGAYRLA
jgi:RNA 2',3'-cyclic 3'-phosphodiesterase